jgi:hypothetical protein
MDFYQMIAYPLSDVKKYLDDLVLNGGSLIRFFVDFIWPHGHPLAGWHFSIFKQVGWYVEPSGTYAGQTFPLFTIANSREYGEPWNEVIWSKWAAILRLCAERGIRVTLSLFDGCSMKTPEDRRWQPLLQNYQHMSAEKELPTYTDMKGISGKRGLALHTGGIYGGFGGDSGTMKSYLPAIVKKLMDTVKASGVDYRINPGNEMAREREGTETQEQVDKILYEWHDYMIQLLKAQGVPNNRIVVSITGTNSREVVSLKLKAKYPGIVEQIHGPNSDVSLERFIKDFPGAEIDGDGQDAKAAGYSNGMMRLPSIAQCKAMRAILKRTGRTYQTFNAHCEPGKGKQNIKLAGWAEQRALAGKVTIK